MQNTSRLALLTVTAKLALACLSASGQQGAVTFKHFKSYPTGEWSQQIQAYRNGAPLGPPQTTTTCSGPLSASQAAGIIKLGNDAAPTCRTKVLVDEERTAEHEQVCNMGPQQQTIHSTMRAIDDRTISLEIRNLIGGQEMSFARITSRYVGVCRADQLPPSIKMPSIPKPTPEECAEVATMKQQAAEGMKGCASSDTPESARASCTAAMQRVAQGVQQMEALCK